MAAKLVSITIVFILFGIALVPVEAAPPCGVGHRICTPTPTPTISSGSVQPVGVGGSWRLVFNDEFTGTILDTTKWVTTYWFSACCDGPGFDGEQQYMLQKNVSVSNGLLHILTKKEDYIGWNGQTWHYTSGMISSGHNGGTAAGTQKFEYQYGYQEIRAKLPKGAGLWTGFWATTQAGIGLPAQELDVVEFLGIDKTTFWTTFHTPDSGSIAVNNPDWSLEYHTYGGLWENGHAAWYVDGVKVRDFYNTSITNYPMYVLFNAQVGADTSWSGVPDPASFPAETVADYIRVWQH